MSKEPAIPLKTLYDCIDFENITNDTVTIKCDGEKLREQIYNQLKIVMDDNPEIGCVALYQDNNLFACINATETITEDDVRRISLELMNRINNEIKTRLHME